MNLQHQYLFSERKAAQLVWDRFLNTQGRPGCNIPADLYMEHLNKRFKEPDVFAIMKRKHDSFKFMRGILASINRDKVTAGILDKSLHVPVTLYDLLNTTH